MFSLGQLQRVELNSGIIFYLHDFLVLTLLATFAFFNSSKLKPYTLEVYAWLKTKPVLLVLLLWIIMSTLIATVSSKFSHPLPLLYLIRVITYLLFALSLKKIFRPLQIHLILSLTGLAMLIFGFAQYALVPDTRFLYILGWDDHYYRLIGTMFDPAFMGAIIIISLGYTLSLLRQKLAHSGPWQLLAILVYSAATILTYSRSSYLALGVFLIITLLSRAINQLKLKQIALGILIVLFSTSVYLLAPKPGGLGVDLSRTATIKARADNTTHYLSQLTLTDLLIGKGLARPPISQGTSTKPNHAKFPDNLFVMLITSFGAPATILAIFQLAKLLKYLNQVDTELFAIFLSLLVHTQFNNTLLQPFVFLFLVCGLTSIIPSIEPKPTSSEN